MVEKADFEISWIVMQQLLNSPLVDFADQCPQLPSFPVSVQLSHQNPVTAADTDRYVGRGRRGGREGGTTPVCLPLHSAPTVTVSEVG